MLSNAHLHRLPEAIVTIPMFSVTIRSLWFVLLVATLSAELIPLSLAFEARFPPLTFYSYVAAKLMAFFVFGFLTPLAWWRYKSLGTGILFAFVTTAIVELGQAFIPGHRTSVIELAVKLVLLFGGFAGALAIRRNQEYDFGMLHLRFSSPYWEQSS